MVGVFAMAVGAWVSVRTGATAAAAPIAHGAPIPVPFVTPAIIVVPNEAAADGGRVATGRSSSAPKPMRTRRSSSEGSRDRAPITTEATAQLDTSDYVLDITGQKR